MYNPITSLGALLLLSPAVLASDLDLSVESGGSNAITVAPGTVVTYSVVGVLTDDLNEGLGMFCFDLAYDGGDLVQADAPVSVNMLNFATPAGFNNPAGFGGTLDSGGLLQVGGAQNTLKSFFAPVPNGNVITGIAATTAPEALVTGSLTAPLAAGTYTLSLGDVRANAIRQGETGTPFWAVEKAPAGAITDLVITVESLSVDVPSLSLAAGGTQTMSLDAGTANAGSWYLTMGSATGTGPLPLGPGANLPLTIDPYWTMTLTSPNIPPLGGSLGILDGSGQSTTTFTLPAASNPAWAGLTLYHAFVLVSPAIAYPSNPVSLLFNS